ncbi:MAG: hypothetical protein JO213_00435 [Alphaproteobacteria bacterium]|nr:hypothetical protein [Alphaproteobacteria bacterium]
MTHVKSHMEHNATTIDQAADEFVEQYGEEAVDVLRARAKAATEICDELAAETWHKTAEAAARKLREASRP